MENDTSFLNKIRNILAMAAIYWKNGQINLKPPA